MFLTTPQEITVVSLSFLHSTNIPIIYAKGCEDRLMYQYKYKGMLVTRSRKNYWKDFAETFQFYSLHSRIKQAFI